MAPDDRKLFLQVLREVFAPELRTDGFRGSGANYRRFRDPVIQVVNIQGSRYGGQCCVNLGLHLSFLPAVGSLLPDPKTLTESACEFRWRLAPEGQQDHWWSYGADEASAKASATRITELYRERGKPQLDQWLDFRDRFIGVTVEGLERRQPDTVPRGATNVRAALAFARIHTHLGNPERAREFAEFGLKHIGRATALQSELERLLRGDAPVG